MNKTIGTPHGSLTTSHDPHRKFVKQSPRDINLLIDLHHLNKKQNLLKHGPVLTKTNYGNKMSPRADDSYEDGEYN